MPKASQGASRSSGTVLVTTGPAALSVVLRTSLDLVISSLPTLLCLCFKHNHGWCCQVGKQRRGGCDNAFVLVGREPRAYSGDEQSADGEAPGSRSRGLDPRWREGEGKQSPMPTVLTQVVRHRSPRQEERGTGERVKHVGGAGRMNQCGLCGGRVPDATGGGGHLQLLQACGTRGPRDEAGCTGDHLNLSEREEMSTGRR